MKKVVSICNLLYDYFVEKAGEGYRVIFLPAGGFSGNKGLNIAEHLEAGYVTHMLDLSGIDRKRYLDRGTCHLEKAGRMGKGIFFTSRILKELQKRGNRIA
ncbi:hypothetical protein [Sediminibacillus massiliensis]|uniref:hypothetical protein n=1 Tax=Sediminibacillus massiliensis TaxID=1926277 RepID=UPI0009885CB8|nr:hypothetical protein [Sediminibacillus massiliensis]